MQTMVSMGAINCLIPKLTIHTSVTVLPALISNVSPGFQAERRSFPTPAIVGCDGNIFLGFGRSDLGSIIRSEEQNSDCSSIDI